MSEEKQVLPPISQFLGIMPELEITIPEHSHSNEILVTPNETQEAPVSLPVTNEIRPIPVSEQPHKKGRQNVKTVFFTPSEDLSLFKTLYAYYGNKPITKVPWSFWDLLRRTTGSDRSDSSLYHHWNGSIVKKYGKLLREGRLHECIQIAEAETKKQTPYSIGPPKLAYSQSQAAYQPLVPYPQYYCPTYQPMYETPLPQPQQRQLIHFRSLPVFNVPMPPN